LNLIFLGYHLSGLKTLNWFLEKPNYTIRSIFLPSNVNQTLVAPLEKIAKKNKIIYFYVNNKYDLLSHLKKMSIKEIDFIISDSWPFLLPNEFLIFPRQGCFNIHEGKLPEYRGAHIMNWQIINGEKEAGISLHQMTDKFDEGDIISYKTVSINFFDDINSLYDKLIKLIPYLLSDLDLFLKNQKSIIKQNNEKAHYYKRRKPEDGIINWNSTSWQIYNLVRALKNPWPSAYTYYENSKIDIIEGYPCMYQDSNIAPGTIIDISFDYALVKTKDGAFLIKSYVGETIKLGSVLQKA